MAAKVFFWGYLLLHNAVSQIYNSGLYFCGFLAIHLISHIFLSLGISKKESEQSEEWWTRKVAFYSLFWEWGFFFQGFSSFFYIKAFYSPFLLLDFFYKNGIRMKIFFFQSVVFKSAVFIKSCGCARDTSGDSTNAQIKKFRFSNLMFSIKSLACATTGESQQQKEINLKKTFLPKWHLLNLVVVPETRGGRAS